MPLPPDVDPSKFTSIIIFPPFHDTFMDQSSDWFMSKNFEKINIDLKMNDLFPFSLIGNSHVAVYYLK